MQSSLSLILLTAFLALTGCMGLILSGELNPVMIFPVVGILPGYYRLIKGMTPTPKPVISSLSVLAIVLVVMDSFVITGDFFLAVAHMTIVFQTLKSFDLKEPWDYLQVYFMSLLQLIITSELTHSIILSVIFTVFLITLVIAIGMSHFIKEGTLRKVRFRKPLIFISLIVLVCTTVFFISLPRSGAGLWGRKSSKGIKSVGFSETVEFGSFGDVLEDSTVVMRISLSGRKQPLYWRGATLDYFDGISWKDTIGGRLRIPKTDDRFYLSKDVDIADDSLTVQDVFIEPMDTDIIFGLGHVVALEANGNFIETDIGGALYSYLKRNRRFSYTAYSTSQDEMALRAKRRHLQVPEGMARVSKLAYDVAGKGVTDLEKAVLIESFLKSNYKYSLKTEPPSSGITPIEDFLFNSKKGFCEHYATSMVLMLRALGVPARIVTGFVAGEENTYGDYVIVKQSNAHSWVEAVINGRWQRFDPTPFAPTLEMPSNLFLLMDSLRMKWYRYVIGFSSYDQMRLLRFITLPFLRGEKENIPSLPDKGEIKTGIKPYAFALAVMALLVTTTFVFWRLRRKGGHGFETIHYLRFRDRIKKMGGYITESSTPMDVLQEAHRLGLDSESSGFEFIRMYEAVRFGGIKMSTEMTKMYQRLSSFQPNSPRRGTKTQGV